MLNLPIRMITVRSEFAPVIYGSSSWYKVEGLVTGAILATGKRTVSAVLRVMGRNDDRPLATDIAQIHAVCELATLPTDRMVVPFQPTLHLGSTPSASPMSPPPTAP